MSADESRKTGILRLRHLREVSEAKAEEMAAAAPRFARLADATAAPRVVSAFNLFQTPEPLAARVVELLADGRDLGRVLEPSAGLGRLYRAVRATSSACPVVLVDSSPECCGELYRATEGDGAARLVAGDFLTLGAERLGGLFDSVAMNPPFKMGSDIRHVFRAYEMLAPRGTLVAICYDGTRQNAALRHIADYWESLPLNAFASSGVRAPTAILRIRKK